MITTLTLNTAEELAALFGEGFKLTMADGQNITIRAVHTQAETRHPTPDTRNHKPDGRGKYSGPPVTCAKGCGRIFTRPQGRGRHELACAGKADLGAGDFWCPQKNCGASFKTKKARTKHMIDEHGVEL